MAFFRLKHHLQMMIRLSNHLLLKVFNQNFMCIYDILNLSSINIISDYIYLVICVCFYLSKKCKLLQRRYVLPPLSQGCLYITGWSINTGIYGSFGSYHILKTITTKVYERPNSKFMFFVLDRVCNVGVCMCTGTHACSFYG